MKTINKVKRDLDWQEVLLFLIFQEFLRSVVTKNFPIEKSGPQISIYENTLSPTASQMITG